MKDRFGNELNVGDEIIFIRPMYRELTTGVITKITEKTIFCDYDCGTNLHSEHTKTTPHDAIRKDCILRNQGGCTTGEIPRAELGS